MKLTEICIRRPVLATVLSLVLVVVGVVTFDRLQVRHYPKIELPRIGITTQFEGASPDIVETQVTKILEDALSGIEGIESMVSRSELERSVITLVFNVNREIDGAANDVRDRIGRVRAKLPPDVQNPQIRKSDADAIPMFYLVLYSDRHDIKDVSDYAKRNLEGQLEVISGVSTVDVWGGGDYQMHVRLDPIKLASYNLSNEEVSVALKAQNIEKPAGHLSTRDREIVLTTKAPLRTEEEFSNVILAERDGYLVRLQDVGKVELDAVEKHFRVRFDGRDAVAFAITGQATANPLNISRDIKKTLPKIRSNLPQGMKIEVANDTSVFIERSIDEVYLTIAEATILVILVIFIFLRSLRASIIPIVTIPLSLIGVFALMYVWGFTVNVLTLLALVMAIGLVVDDAIVMLENIYRHIENGMSPMAAAFKGSREISFAIVAMTITLAAVYAPIALSSGATGKVFTEFALTLAGAVILSGFIALTLSPMMCSRLLRIHKVKDPDTVTQTETNIVIYIFKKMDAWIGQTLNRTDIFYGEKLRAFLSITLPTSLHGQKVSRFARLSVTSVAVGVIFIGIYVGMNIKKDLSPQEDQGYVKAKGYPPQGASLDYVDKYMLQAEKIFLAVPEMGGRLALIQAPGEPSIEGYLVPWEKRKRSSMEIAKELRPGFNNITGMSFGIISKARSLIGGGGRGKPIEVILQTTKPYEELVSMFQDFASALREIPGIDKDNIEDTLSADEQEYVVKIKRDEAGASGVTLADIGQMLDTFFSGRTATYFKKESYRYPVTLELEEKFRKSREDIASLYIKGQRGREQAIIPLSELITVEKQLVPTEIHHFGGLRSGTLFAELAPGYGLGEVLEQIKEKSAQVLPEGSQINFAGESKRFLEESSNILLIFGLAVISIYLVLAAQYESYLDPLIIMVSVPLSLVGGLVTLLIADGSFTFPNWIPHFESGILTIFGQIGLVTLIGLITKHGILMVDFANKLLEDNHSRLEAIILASRQRLRPILMTTFAMVLGAVPLALASGAGYESRRQIGWVIVGGMSIGTIFTLFVVPTVYVYISRENLWAVVRLIGLFFKHTFLNLLRHPTKP
jgi:multidrug efflux pump